jgi:hypothetical protein
MLFKNLILENKEIFQIKKPEDLEEILKSLKYTLEEVLYPGLSAISDSLLEDF